MFLQFFAHVRRSYFPLLIPAPKYLDDAGKRPRK